MTFFFLRRRIGLWFLNISSVTIRFIILIIRFLLIIVIIVLNIVVVVAIVNDTRIVLRITIIRRLRLTFDNIVIIKTILFVYILMNHLMMCI